jgi:hypothetical protein
MLVGQNVPRRHVIRLTKTNAAEGPESAYFAGQLVRWFAKRSALACSLLVSHPARLCPTLKGPCLAQANDALSALYIPQVSIEIDS